jgi:hypothetical protein
VVQRATRHAPFEKRVVDALCSTSMAPSLQDPQSYLAGSKR